MKITDYICFKPPTVYDIIATAGIVVAVLILWNIKDSQAAMQRDYVTKDFIYYFYVNKDQIKMIQEEHSNVTKRIKAGEDIDVVNAHYRNYVDMVLDLTSRGEELKEVKR